MFCPKCGKELSDDAVFCNGCGAKIGGDPAPEEKKAPAKEGAKASLPKLNFDKGAVGKLLYVVTAYLIFRMFTMWITSGISVNMGTVSAILSEHDMLRGDKLTAISIITIILLLLSVCTCLVPLFYEKMNKLILIAPAAVCLWSFIWYVVELSSATGAGPGFYGIIFILFTFTAIGILTYLIVKSLLKK